MAFALLVCLSMPLVAQEQGPYIVTLMRGHWNMDMEDFSMEEWKKHEMEYHEKVIMKNEYIVGSAVLLHTYTPDNSEILFGQVYANWADVEKAVDRNRELAQEAWPDDEERSAFFDKQGSYYSHIHSDEIYSTMSLAKPLSELPTEPVLYYLRTSHTAPWPEDGSGDEVQALRKEYVENVIHKSEHVMGYYPMRHLYGADSRDMIEVMVVKDMADLEAMNDGGLQKLVEAQWPDQEQRNAFFDSMDKYMEPWHSDLIYTCVPELMK